MVFGSISLAAPKSAAKSPAWPWMLVLLIAALPSFKVNTTSAAENGPQSLWKITPSRILIVTLLRSEATSYDSASLLTMDPLSSTLKRPSPMPTYCIVSTGAWALPSPTPGPTSNTATTSVPTAFFGEGAGWSVGIAIGVGVGVGGLV